MKTLQNATDDVNNFICNECTNGNTLDSWGLIQAALLGIQKPSCDKVKEVVFLEYIESMCMSPDTDSKNKIRGIEGLINDWRNGKEHP